jgi:hypothetical protein
VFSETTQQASKGDWLLDVLFNFAAASFLLVADDY